MSRHRWCGTVAVRDSVLMASVVLAFLVVGCSTAPEPQPLLDVPATSASESSTSPIDAPTELSPTVSIATAVPTEVPTTVLPTEAPTIPPALPPPPTAPPAAPTEPPPPRPDYSDPAADRNCSDFVDGWEAQRWWEYWRARGSNNPGGLDGDDDGDVCESNK